eukprot:TRINITY_DN7940_c2_g1_i1.p1 TRINITY_DN7940_c2_g1~~TRINITY_DN7940_c2_g1_i1.p1  ORF type:complete len:662 (+),score=217.37 TRINITY_DN7940_c2_g1_i1:83-1987(+)
MEPVVGAAARQQQQLQQKQQQQQQPPAPPARACQCAQCGFVFRAAAGGAYKCPGCAQIIDVPEPKAVAVPEPVPQAPAPAVQQTNVANPFSTKPNIGVPAKTEPPAAVNDRRSRAQRAVQVGIERVQGHPWVSCLRSSPEWQWALPAPGACDEHLCVLMMGGINMVGRAEECPAVIRKPLSGPAWHCDSGGRMAKGCAEPMHPPDGQGTGIGLGRAFARRVLRNLPRHGIFLIPCAVGHGDTTMNAWHRDGVLYSISVARGRTAAQAVGGRVAGILWHNGEQDACTHADAAAYEDRLSTMLANLREDFDDPELPIVVGEIGESFLSPQSTLPDAHKGARAINHALRRVGHQPYTECVLAPATCLHDKVCFDAAGMEEYGVRYAEAWEKLWSKRLITEQRVGPDGMPHTKEHWLLTFGNLVVDQAKGANGVWAAADTFKGQVERLEPRKPGEGSPERKRRRRREEGGGERDRRRRRKEKEAEEEAEDNTGLKEKLMKIVMGGLSMIAAQNEAKEGPGDKEEDEKIRQDQGFDDRVQVECPTKGCGKTLDVMPQQLLDVAGMKHTHCDGESCSSTMLLLRAAHSGWRCCLKCESAFCRDCVGSLQPAGENTTKKEERDDSDREDSPGPRKTADNEA